MTKRWRGLKDLVQAAIDEGSRAVERVQLESAQRPFLLLQAIPSLTGPVQLIAAVHDGVVRGVHSGIRLGNRALGTVLDAVIDVTNADQKRP